ncbi:MULTISPECIES: BREX-1 system phosphatase PglZ type A [unclassified Ectothiorhodospira]|uniref:BREX-1 system phosphatase PglZ type A n=1 Tax=unclassified Ectothiorhodospira TaxID=2684909 RepID=UPI001EE7BCFD|nr:MULTISPECIES: BREX-1 system phosphatase PglZ type A [unclassified Ectothiorhodospira]MCG5516256.1 BREX-1 system phosphatase PglZ type A [Ectothiorhodospira sp. 9100]MCG5518071.1 BREX-1 system phosphatase PglZ type A [Ectothiorhodospira sp. 9905]
MSQQINRALSRLFDKHRIVFWYDTKQELRSDFEAVSVPDVEKLEIANNEYGLKYRVLRESPEQKFLLYKEGPKPEDLDNWLLDVQLAHGEFRTDQVAIWLSELELGLEFAEVAQAHTEFFQAIRRKEALKKLLKPDDTAGQLRLKMLAVCAGSEPRMDSVVETLLQQLAEGRDEGVRLIERCGLDGFLWEQLTRFYGYEASEPSLRDFALELFKSCYAMGTDGEVKLTGDALVFLKRWKDSRQFEKGFETLSAECAEVLGIEQDLGRRDFRDLVELDYFRLIDQKIISDLVRAVVGRTVTSGDVALWVRQRRQGHWYGEFRHLYEAIEFAARFVQMLSEASLTMDSLTEGVQRYSRTWFQLDQLYRKFTYHVRMSGQASLMGELSERVENLYSNNYLLKLGDAFQIHVDAAPGWEAYPVVQQKAFFEHWVRPYLRKDKRICVIISDAMRYEIGDELLGLIRQEDRYSAELEPALSTLPSYTQLGMAALLPNKSLAIADNDTGTVLVDGQSSQGTTNRTKILQAALDGRGQAVKAEDFMQLNREESRELLKGHDVLYIYHNRIDHTGDKMHSEGQAFEAAEQTLGDLIRLIKKLTAANANNLLITADHGFIYQDHELDESDFLGDAVSGEDVRYRDRRFVLGKGLSTSPAFHHFSSEQLGLDGDMEVQIPRSINRLRLKGSGSRFVHGGACLQEVVIPVLKVNKKRQSDVSAVEVDILRGASSVITSGQLAVTVYQSTPVTEKVQPRHLRAGIYTQSGELISDSHELSFDLTSENPREREFQVRFVLSRKADEANGQEVFLKLEEQHAGTSHYKEYKSLRYLMRRSFTSDFDF